MAYPYDDNGFRHYLKFYDFNMDWYEICEPVGFDGAKYVKKQLSNRWTRDVEYFAIDGLTFPDVFGEKLLTPRVYNPQGDLSEYMDYGLWYLLENRRLKGSEMKVGPPDRRTLGHPQNHASCLCAVGSTRYLDRIFIRPEPLD